VWTEVGLPVLLGREELRRRQREEARGLEIWSGARETESCVLSRAAAPLPFNSFFKELLFLSLFCFFYLQQIPFLLYCVQAS
jgi:hypothetical protein